MLGVVRLHRDAEAAGGEYAVIVRSALKGRGLGWLLMQRMIEYARTLGLKSVHGQVLAENTTMLRMCAELGFQVGDDPHSKGVKVVTLDLAQPAASGRGAKDRPGKGAGKTIRRGVGIFPNPDGTKWLTRLPVDRRCLGGASRGARTA